MSMVRMTEERLPAGFRFHPRDEELVCDYLEKKISSAACSCSGCFSSSTNGNSDHEFCSPQMFIDVDLNKCEPWDLPEMACVGGKEWYFFNLHDRKYSTGQRTNRATQSGYWKATGKDRLVMRKQMLVGMRKTLVFYQGRAPTGKKTDWVMHEFRMETKQHLSNFSTKIMISWMRPRMLYSSSPPPTSEGWFPGALILEDWVLCRVSFKSRTKAPKQMPAMTAADNHFYNYGSSSSSIPPLIHTYINFDGAHGEHDASLSHPLVMPAAAAAHQPALPLPSEGHLSWRPTWARS